MSEPKAIQWEGCAFDQTKGFRAFWKQSLDRLWLQREHDDGDPYQSLQIRLEQNGCVSVFWQAREQSPIRHAEIPYDEFFEAIRKTFFPTETPTDAGESDGEPLYSSDL